MIMMFLFYFFDENAAWSGHFRAGGGEQSALMELFCLFASKCFVYRNREWN